MHGGKSPRALQAAEERIERARIGRELARIGILDEDPIEGLLVEVGRSAAAVEFIEGEISQLDQLWVQRRDVKVTEQPVEEGGLSRSPREVTIKDAVPHVLVRMWGEERERHARFCKMALDAGIDERRVRIQEEQGVMMARVIAAVLDDLGLSRDQRQAANKAVGRHLRALPSA
jgi:hypothetical protein